MFCPKCGTKNPNDARFCRKCGTNLGNVSDALSGKSSEKNAGWGTIQPIDPIKMKKSFGNLGCETQNSNDPTDIYANAIKQILTGIGFLIVAIALLTTGVAGGKAWWWAMLFPAFGSLGKGISDYMKSRRMEQRQLNMIPEPKKTVLDQPPANSALPLSNTDYVPADFSGYQTGDLVPPSVVEHTTRHLEPDSEGETMTLPKSNL